MLLPQRKFGQKRRLLGGKMTALQANKKSNLLGPLPAASSDPAEVQDVVLTFGISQLCIHSMGAQAGGASPARHAGTGTGPDGRGVGRGRPGGSAVKKAIKKAVKKAVKQSMNIQDLLPTLRRNSIHQDHQSIQTETAPKSLPIQEQRRTMDRPGHRPHRTLNHDRWHMPALGYVSQVLCGSA
eukprot:jgi/Ulvmu1/3014/UM015_0054.1